VEQANDIPLLACGFNFAIFSAVKTKTKTPDMPQDYRLRLPARSALFSHRAPRAPGPLDKYATLPRSAVLPPAGADPADAVTVAFSEKAFRENAQGHYGLQRAWIESQRPGGDRDARMHDWPPEHNAWAITRGRRDRSARR